MDILLPRDSQIFYSANGRNLRTNYGLWLNKMAPCRSDKFHLIDANQETKPYGRFESYEEVIPVLHSKQGVCLQELFGKIKLQLNFTTTWRLAIGLGIESVYETGLSLHPVYGFPMIPASSIKGVLRSWIIEEVFGKDEGKALKESKLFCDIFGCGKNSWYGTERQGMVTFLDAYPQPGFRVEPEVMTPHYTEYYTGDKPPADWLSPKPVIFLTVTEAIFGFRMGWSNRFEEIKSYQHIKKGEKSPVEDPLWRATLDRTSHLLPHSLNLGDLLNWWLTDVLKNHGIGAKTAVGYGRMLKKA